MGADAERRVDHCTQSVSADAAAADGAGHHETSKLDAAVPVRQAGEHHEAGDLVPVEDQQVLLVCVIQRHGCRGSQLS